MQNNNKEIFECIMSIKSIFLKYDIHDKLYILNTDSNKYNKVYFKIHLDDNNATGYVMLSSTKDSFENDINTLKKTYIDKNITPIFMGFNSFSEAYTHVDEYIGIYFKKERRLYNLNKLI